MVVTFANWQHEDACVRQNAIMRTIHVLKTQKEAFILEKEELIECLWAVTSSDETRINRCMAALALSYIFDSVKTIKRRTAIAKDILGLFFSLFPKNLKKTLENNPSYFNQGSFKSSKRTSCRLLMISAVAYLLEQEDFQHLELVDYYDSLLVCLLESNSIFAFQKAALNVLNNVFQVNKLSNLRINKKFRSTIKVLVQNLKESPPSPEVEDSELIQQSLKREIDKFYGKWPVVENVRRPSKILHRPSLVYDPKKPLAPEPEPFLLPLESYLEDIVPNSLVSAEDTQKPSHNEIIQVKFDNNTLLTFPFRFPFERQIAISNETLNETTIQLVCQPHDIFQAKPAIIELKAEEKTTVIISFNPKKSLRYVNAEIMGTIFIRSSDFGTILDQMSLKAFRVPAVNVFPSKLSFLAVQVGLQKDAKFNVHNLLPCDCPCITIALPGPHTDSFQISNGIFILQAGETKAVTISFEPKKYHSKPEYVDFIVLAAGYQLQKIHAVATSSNALYCYDDIVTIPLMDITDVKVTKRILLENPLTKHPLPYYLTSTNIDLYTDLLAAHYSTADKLCMGNKAKLPVHFEPLFRGPRKEFLNIVSTHGEFHLPLNTFVGPVVYIPIFKDLIFPLTFIENDSTLTLPIINLYGTGLELVLSLPKNSAFTIEEPKPSCLGPPKEYGDNIEHILKFGSKHYVDLTIRFRGFKLEPLRVPLIIAPKNIRGYPSQTIYLNGICYCDNQLNDMQQFGNVVQCIVDPRSLAMTETKFPSIEQQGINYYAPCTSQSFELEPSTLTIVNDLEQDIYQFVTLTNLTTKEQPYLLLLSKPFITNIPIEGILNPMSSIEIPIFLDFNWIESNCPVESLDPKDIITSRKQHTYSGTLIVLDRSNVRAALLQTNLVGVLYDLVTLEVSENLKLIKFPKTKVMETSERKIYIRNKAPFEVVVNVDLESQRREEKTFFTLDFNKTVLKPYECKPLHIKFQSFKPGDSLDLMEFSYEDPIRHVIHGVLQEQRRVRHIASIALEGSVGTPEILLSSNHLDFGEMPIGTSIDLPLKVSNFQGCSTTVMLVTFCPNISFDPEVFILESNEEKIVNVTYHSKDREDISSFFDVVADGIQHTVTFIASSGHTHFDFKIQNLVKFEPVQLNAEKNVFDLGFINSFKPSPYLVLAENKSDFDFFLNSKTTMSIKDSTGVPLSENEMLMAQCQMIQVDGEFLFDPTNISEILDRQANKQLAKNTVIKKPKKVVDARSVINQNQSSAGGDKEDSQIIYFPKNCTIPFLLKFQQSPQRNKIEISASFSLISRSGKEKIQKISLIGQIQPAVQCIQKTLDFGTLKLNGKKEMSFTLKNYAQSGLVWGLSYISRDCVSVQGPEFKEQYSSPFHIFPEKGFLQAGQTTEVNVVFLPKSAQAEYTATLGIWTEGDVLGGQIDLKGLGASAYLVTDTKSIDFGIIRVGTQKEVTIELENRGILSTPFFIESNLLQFSAQPEQGQIDGRKKIPIKIIFKPKETKVQATKLMIHASRNIKDKVTSKTSDVYVIDLYGEGSFPEIHVLTKAIDFGTSLFSVENSKYITIENRGSADASIVYSCYHPGVFLVYESQEDGTARSQTIVIPAHTEKEVKVVYAPKVVETLKTKLFIRSSDHRADYQMVTVAGIVGIPKIIIDRMDLWDNLQFGVCRLFSKTEKSFRIKNDGNIPLNFAFSVDLLRMSNLEEGASEIPIQNTESNVIMIYPFRGHLKVGETAEIKFIFTPTGLAEYVYNVILNYDFVKMNTRLTGSGGRPLIKFESPLRYIDFGTCRTGRRSLKSILISNSGNMPETFVIRCRRNQQQANGQDISAMTDIAYLASFGFQAPTLSGMIEASMKREIPVEFFPLNDGLVKILLEFTVGEETLNLEVFGTGASAQMNFLDEAGKMICSSGSYNQNTTGGMMADNYIPQIDFGVHPVSIEYQSNYILQNQSPFSFDFFIESLSLQEFVVHPMKGHILANTSVPIKIIFKAQQDIKCKQRLKIFWDEKPLMVDFCASGGKGRLEVFAANKDLAQVMATVTASVNVQASSLKSQTAQQQQQQNQNELLKNGIDFGVVEFNTSVIDHFLLVNTGQIDVKANLRIDHDDFTMCISPIETEKEQLKHELFLMSDKLILPPGKAKKVFVKFIPKTSSAVSTVVHIRSEALQHVPDSKDNLRVTLRGSGGNFSILHRGDLTFDNIATYFTYKKNIQILNSGSIPSKIEFYWTLIGHQNTGTSLVTLVEKISPDNPRSGWRKWLPTTLLDVNENVVQRRWTLLRYMIRKYQLIELLDLAATKRIPGVTLTRDGHHRMKKMFMDSVFKVPISSQSLPKEPCVISVTPETSFLASFGEVVIEVSVNVPFQETLLGTLHIRSSIPNTEPYAIPLIVNAKHVNIFCEGIPFLNFSRQAIGEEEVMLRKFRNQGQKDVVFNIHHENTSLRIVPMRGLLKVGQSTRLSFIFKPVDESVQNGDIIFQPDCSQPIRLKMWGAGGFVKCSLSKYRRFDFGRCMIGKETISYLPIVNEGNCVLNLVSFEITVDADAFYKHPSWPNDRIKLPPGGSFKLPIIFCPKEETMKTGTLVVQTTTDKWDIEFVGIGREAVLIIANTSIDFTDCLIGNVYEQTLVIKNVGDVNYPVSFKMDKDENDLEFIPKSLVMQPFSEGHVIVAYSPTKECKKNMSLTVSSPYSTNKLPMNLHSGVADLVFDRIVLDYGLFEMTSDPEIILKMTNIGSIKTSFTILDNVKPSRFMVEPNKGIISAQETIQVKVKHCHHVISTFDDWLTVSTDLIDKKYSLNVKGQCEESIMIPDEFSNLNMGICPVLDMTTKEISFRNYGKFPVTYDIKATYPLKVTPSVGTVPGEGMGAISVHWTPSGAYELRSQLSIKTNIGTFQINVRGKSNFPELLLDKDRIDFGVCAVGRAYTQTLTLINAGKVPLHFNIPQPAVEAFTVSERHGLLEAKESREISVFFEPSNMEKFSAKIIVECRGISFKELNVVGIGGQFGVEITPEYIDLDNRSCHVNYTESINIKNVGDLILRPSFEVEYVQGECRVVLLPPHTENHSIDLLPQHELRYPFKIMILEVGEVIVNIYIQFYEETYVLQMRAAGTEIELSEGARRLLEEEELISTMFLTPLQIESQLPELDRQMRRITVTTRETIDNQGNPQESLSHKKIAMSATGAHSLQHDEMERSSYVHSNLSLKSDSQDPTSLSFMRLGSMIEDYIIDLILNSVNPKVDYQDIKVLTNQRDPEYEEDLTLILSRPAPVLLTDVNFKNRDKRPRPYVRDPMSLDKRTRHSRASGLFDL